MPVTKSAKKKLRQDKKRTRENEKLKKLLATLVKKAQKTKTAKAIKDAIRTSDIASKKNIIHKNKAARIKSKLSKLVKPAQKPAKKSPRKPA